MGVRGGAGMPDAGLSTRQTCRAVVLSDDDGLTDVLGDDESATIATFGEPA